ncbi:helix-turn-helix domain-containing protein [Rhizobium johnstonii]|uniref:helix-turn-helix domain-containing protein n=1 Tax=Rhizobium johnstonii TaxID=3019933 RepID=UPI003F9AA469
MCPTPTAQWCAGPCYPYFRRLFREQTGMSAKQHQMRVRLQRAIDLLVNTEKSIKKIAGLLGFHSAFHFSTQFRQLIDSSQTGFRAAKRS